jgi:hypothetical protein
MDLQVGISELEIAISGPSIFCSPSDILTYSNAVRKETFKYLWSVDGGTLLNASNARFAEISVQDSALIQINLYDTKSGCSDSSELKVIRTDHVDKDFVYESANCATFTFKTLHSCDSTYFWDFGDGTLDSTQHTVHTYQDTGYFHVQLISAGDTVTKQIYVGMKGSDLVLSGDSTNCDDTAFYAYSVPYSPIHTYHWSSTGTKEYSEMGNTVSTKWATDGNIQVIVKNTINNCVDTVSSIVVKDLPELDFTFSSTNCKDVQFQTSYYCGLPIKWIFGDSTTWNIPKTSNVQNPINTYKKGKTYLASLVVNGDTLTKEILIKENFQLDVILDAPSMICDTSELHIITIADYNPLSTYYWSATGGDTPISVNDSMFSIKFNNPNASSLVLNITNQNGCPGSSSANFSVHSGLPFINPEIIGDSLYCDTTIGVPYSVPSYPYQYTWSVTNGNTLVTGSQPNETDVKWDTLGVLKVVISDPSSGCKDSATLDVNKASFINDLNPHVQQVCQNSEFVAFDGIPTGVDTSLLLYQWFRGSQIIPGATNRGYIPSDQLSLIGIYKRLAYTNTGCFSYSTDVIAQTNQLYNNIYFSTDLACFTGAPFMISGTTPHNAQGAVSYYWQSSSDSISWTSTSITTKNFSGVIGTEKKYYRRHATWTASWGTSTCSFFSNVITIQPSVYIEKQPTDAYGCSSSTGTWSASVKVSHPLSTAISYILEYKKIGTSNWIPSSIPSDSVSRYYGYPYSAGMPSNLDSIRFKINTSCGQIYSDIAVIRDISSVPTFTTQPNNQNAAIGSVASFSASANMNSPSYNIFWQRQLEGTTDWITIENSDSNTLNYTPLDFCDDQAKFRMVAENNCGASYSNSAILTVNDLSDIWMRDHVTDTGLEPNPDTYHYHIVRSPAIWNRHDPDFMQGHEGIEFKLNSPNQLNIKVRNKGSVATQPTNL